MEETSSFISAFGDTPLVKVLDFFIDNREFDYSLTDIAKGSGIAWSTLHIIWPKFLNLGIVTKTRRIGRAELFKLDQSSPIVKKLLEIDEVISKEMIRRQTPLRNLNKKLIIKHY